MLNRAIHSLLDVASWEWAANVDGANINEGVDPMFDTIQQHMNSQTNFKYDITWIETKQVFVWLMRQLHYIAKHGVPQYKNLYSNFQLPPQLEGLWKLKTDLAFPTEV